MDLYYSVLLEDMIACQVVPLVPRQDFAPRGLVGHLGIALLVLSKEDWGRAVAVTHNHAQNHHFLWMLGCADTFNAILVDREQPVIARAVKLTPYEDLVRENLQYGYWPVLQLWEKFLCPQQTLCLGSICDELVPP